MVSHNFTEVPASSSNKRRHSLWLKWKGFVRSKFKSLHHRAATIVVSSTTSASSPSLLESSPSSSSSPPRASDVQLIRIGLRGSRSNYSILLPNLNAPNKVDQDTSFDVIQDAISPSADSCNNGESIYKSPLDHSAAKHRMAVKPLHRRVATAGKAKTKVHKSKNAIECQRAELAEGAEGDGEQGQGEEQANEAALYEEIASPEEEDAQVKSGRGNDGDDDFTEVKAVTVVEPVPDSATTEDPKEDGDASDDEAALLSRLLSVTKAARNKLARSKSFSSSTALRMVKKKKKLKNSTTDAELSGNESDGGTVSVVVNPQPAPAPPRSSSSAGATGDKAGVYRSCLNSNVTFKRASASPPSSASSTEVDSIGLVAGHERFLTSIQNWTLANEGLKRSIFGLGSGGSTNAASSDGSPTGTRTTRINSCGCSTSSSKSSDSTCNCSGDGQSICSEPSIDIEYIPPPPTESNVTTENDVDNVNTENDVDNIKTVTVVVEREESTKETNESPVYSQDREIAVVNDENNNEVIKEEDDGNHGTSAENDITVVGALEEDVCENVNVKEMRKFFIEQKIEFRPPGTESPPKQGQDEQDLRVEPPIEKEEPSSSSSSSSSSSGGDRDQSLVQYIVAKFDGISSNASSDNKSE